MGGREGGREEGEEEEREKRREGGRRGESEVRKGGVSAGWYWIEGFATG